MSEESDHVLMLVLLSDGYLSLPCWAQQGREIFLVLCVTKVLDRRHIAEQSAGTDNQNLPKQQLSYNTAG